ncbi:MAG: alpha/beta fold hydrolase [Elusimicrobia bacterium]|nr:alpha/beta fold hydrolase [Elusimicrobiota bacterium]
MKPHALLFLALLLPASALDGQNAHEPRLEERITLTADDGWKLNARYLKAAESSPTAVLIHSQKSDLTEWNFWFDYLKRYGYGYLAMDLRGHGLSFVMPNGSTTTYKAFAISGSNNEFNKMIRDVEAAIAYLSTNSVTGDRIILVGSIMGANLAIKAAAIHPDISMAAAISPVLNVNDVLSVNPLYAYGKRPLLMIAGANRAKQYKEFQLLNDIAKSACGKANVTIMVEAKGFGAEIVTKYNVRKIFDWFKNPRLPVIVEHSTAAVTEEPSDAPVYGEPRPPEELPDDEAAPVYETAPVYE